MKFCTTCGEVYASAAKTCAADDSPLRDWVPPRRASSPKEEEHTDVEILDAGTPTTIAASGKAAHSSNDEHTSIVATKAQATLTDFHAGNGGGDVGELVCYDDETGGPFRGMVISNRYRLESQIGTGAFGVVFDATDKENDRRVAVKLLSPALSVDKRALTRFRREAIAASRIKHPGIVDIYDFGMQDEGVSYIVMEFLAGRDLAVLLEQESLISPRRAAAIVTQCASALAAAHDAGVLHRDLKPANIFVVRHDDGSEHIKILDFGIAKDRSSNPRTADLTSASKVVGTPYYMSPEQAQGLTLDSRGDVYSLGVILYELLTGTRPFEGPTIFDILTAHVSAERIAPSKVRPELASEVALERIVLRAINAKRDARFASMHEFAAALEAYLAEPVSKPTRESAPRTTSLPMPAPGIVTAAEHAPKKRSSLWWTLVPVVAAVGLLVFFVGSPGKSTQAEVTPPAAASVQLESIVIYDAGIADAIVPTPTRRHNTIKKRSNAIETAERSKVPRAPQKGKRRPTLKTPKMKTPRPKKKNRGIEEW